MKVCKKCKKQVPNKLKICRYCGADVSKAKIISKKKNIAKKEVVKEELSKDVIEIKTINKDSKKVLIKKYLLKNKKNIIKILIGIIILFIIILLSINLYNSLFDISTEVSDNNKSFEVNDTVRYRDVNYRIKKVEINDVGTEYKKPKKDNWFIIVTLEFENKSDKAIKYSSKNWKLESEESTSKRVFTGLDVNTALYSGKLVIGAVKSGTLVFEQPKKYNNLKLNYYEISDNKDDEDKLIFSINIEIDKDEKLTKK